MCKYRWYGRRRRRDRTSHWYSPKYRFPDTRLGLDESTMLATSHILEASDLHRGCRTTARRCQRVFRVSHARRHSHVDTIAVRRLGFESYGRSRPIGIGVRRVGPHYGCSCFIDVSQSNCSCIFFAQPSSSRSSYLPTSGEGEEIKEGFARSIDRHGPRSS